MTVGSDLAQSGPYLANGVTTSFPFSFDIDKATDLAVVWLSPGGEEVVISSGAYGVTISESEPGGAVIFSVAPTPPNAGDELWIFLDPEFEQQDRYSDEGPFNQSLLEGSLDRLARLSIWLKNRVDRGIIGSLGDEALVLPPASGRTNRFIAFDAAGRLILSNGAGGDSGLRADLGEDAGSELVIYKRSAPGARARTWGDKGRDRLDLRDFNGLDLTGSNSSAAAVQAASNEAVVTGERLHVPAGTIVLDEPIEIVGSMAMEGQNWPSRLTDKSTWFHLAHEGKGFVLSEVGNTHSIDISRVGTFRDHAAVGGGWEPTDHDWDFDILGDDVSFDEINTLNPFKGIRLNASGRLEINRMRGQPLGIGVEIVSSTDVCRLTNVHLWPFWNDEEVVKLWMQTQATGLYSKRNDNPTFAFCFSIWLRYGLRFGRNAGGGAGVAGVTSKFKAFGCDFDIGTQSVVVDADADGVTGDFFGLSCQGRDDADDFANPLLHIQSDNCNIGVMGLRGTQAGGNVVRVEGAGNKLALIGMETGAYNLTGFGFPIVEAEPGNDVTISSDWRKSSPGVAVGCRIDAGEWTSYVPTVTAQTGTITALGAVSARYRQRGRTVEWTATVNITTNGTAGGDIRVSLPAGLAPAFDAIGTGRETATTGEALQAWFQAIGRVDVTTFNNGYPGANGRRLLLSGQYEVA